MTEFSIKNVEHLINGIVKVEAENKDKKCMSEIMLPSYELEVDLKPGITFSMHHHEEQNNDHDYDVTFFGTICMSTPDYVLISNGGLLIGIKSVDACLNISKYGKQIYTHLSFKQSKKRGRPSKSLLN